MNPRLLIHLAVICSAILALFAMSGAGPIAAARSKPASPSAAIQFSEPDGSQTVHEGDDFFTTTFADPLDMNNPEDVDTEDREDPNRGPSWNPAYPLAGGGSWSATSLKTDSSLWLLFPGWDVQANALGARNGRVEPVDAARYSHLVLKLTASQPTDAAAYWYQTNKNPGAGQIGRSANADVHQGANLVDIDLNSGGGSATWNSQPNWGGIRLDPAEYHANTSISIDWARLVPADGGPTITARWSSCSDCQSFDIYADLDNNSENGGLLKLAGPILSSTVGSEAWNSRDLKSRPH